MADKFRHHVLLFRRKTPALSSTIGVVIFRHRVQRIFGRPGHQDLVVAAALGVAELQLIERHVDHLAADPEETADRNHRAERPVVANHQIVDTSDLLILVIINRRSDDLAASHPAAVRHDDVAGQRRIGAAVSGLAGGVMHSRGVKRRGRVVLGGRRAINGTTTGVNISDAVISFSTESSPPFGRRRANRPPASP
jgi:hypothetical protein